MSDLPVIADAAILAARPAKNRIDTARPYACLIEPERTAHGTVEDVATIFLANRECAFRCLMCDLWRNTTDETVPPGAIPEQIDFALAELPRTKHVKLYNSGNFFDVKAIPREDRPGIAERVQGFETVIVENHPKLCTDDCLRFRDSLDGQLEVAVGLETIHPDILPRLNKQMTLNDFTKAVDFLVAHDIRVRTFVLLRPPFLTESEGVEWALRSIRFAFDAGVECCSVVPTRAGNGIMDRLERRGEFSPPSILSMERVLNSAFEMRRGRVFMDLWDAEQFSRCDRCCHTRIANLRDLNLSQSIRPQVTCVDCGND